MRFWLIAALGVASPTVAAAQAVPGAARPGTATEAMFDAGITAQDQIDWVRQMASAPNHVGSPHNRANAEFLLAKFKEWGWDARIESYDVLYPTPISTTIEMIAPQRVTLGGQEPPLGPDTADPRGALPPYVVYQGDGDVTAPIVYVNYGMPDDYVALARRGIDVRGKIVIARYGSGWRGLKPKLAQEHGAAGCIIYSDPADDGYAKGDVYPDGGARPGGGVQRGSVSDTSIYPGDPLTPGTASKPGTRRLSRADAATIVKIPTLPMSYGDAQKLLSALRGPVAPAPFRGGLPITYRIGGDDAVTVHLAVKSDWSPKPVHNVIATLKGARHPDEWVIRGNHYDGWVYGAWDPLSGVAAMLSEAKALGTLARGGWRPARTIVYAAWDGEEPGLLGSTEWGEDHARELRAKAVAYINTDVNSRGFLLVNGTPDYQGLVGKVAATVIDPQTGVSVLARQQAGLRVGLFDRTGYADEATAAALERGGDIPLAAVGAGSDFAVFAHHLGIPVLNLGFGGQDDLYGVYHSIYDNFHHLNAYADPGLQYGVTLAQVTGRLVMRIAEEATLPRKFTDVAASIAGYIAQLKRLEDTRRAEDRQRDTLTGDRAFAIAGDPKRPVAAPPSLDRTPRTAFAALENASDRLTAAAGTFDRAFAALDAALDPARRTRVNALLRDISQLFLDDRGLPGRPWYRNLISASGRLTGYTAKTLPGVREAIEERRFAEAADYADRTARVIDTYAARLETARKALTD